MRKNYSRMFLEQLLGAVKIDKKLFYKLVDALYNAPSLIDSSSIHLSMSPARDAYVLRARYIGTERINNNKEGRSVRPEAETTAKRIYENITTLSGIEFVSVYPIINKKECIGYVKMTETKSRTSPLVLELFSDLRK